MKRCAGWGTVLLAMAVGLGCEGRTVEGTDEGPRVELPDNGGNDVRPTDGGRDPMQDQAVEDGEIGPVANTIGPIQQSDTSVQCPPAGTTTAPQFVNGGTGLAVDAVIVSPRWVISKDSTTGNPKLYGYAVADAGLRQSEAWRGAVITVTPDLNLNEWALGDFLSLTVDHQEYYCFTQLKVTAAIPMGQGPVPAPLVIDPADLGSQDPSRAEPLEGVLVQVRNVEVIETPHNGSDGKDHGAFAVTGGLVVVNDFGLPYMSRATDARKLGDRFDSITGIVKYSYGEYVLAPRFPEDMVAEGQTPPEGGEDTGTGRDVIEPPETWTDTGVSGTTIQQIQDASQSTGCTASSSIQTIQQGITFAPMVVISPKYVASANKLDGYVVADLGQQTAQPYRGTLLTVDVAQGTAFQPGDVLAVQGDWVEFYCLTEIKATAVQKTGTAEVPAPRLLSAGEITGLAGQDPATCEPLEGVLVELQDVVVTDANPDQASGKDYGSFAVAGGVIVANTFKVSYMNKDTDQRRVGDRFSRLVGVVSYSFGKYVLLPRHDQDLVLATQTPEAAEPTPDVPVTDPGSTVDPGTPTDPGTDTAETRYSVRDLQQGAASVGCTANSIQTIQAGIRLKPVVVMTPRFSAAQTLHGYYVADTDRGADSWGMLVVVAKTLNTDWKVGDLVAPGGDHVEYYCMTEFTAKDHLETVGTAAVPNPVTLQASALEGGGTAALEPMEGLLVSVEDVSVTATTSTNGWFQVGNGIEVVQDVCYASPSIYTPQLNDHFTRLTGVLKYHYGKYRIAPRSLEDMVR